MEQMRRNWLDGSVFLMERATTALEDLLHAQLSIEAQSLALRDDFRRIREELQRAAQDEANASARPGRRGASMYAPLNLFARGRNGSLEIYWQEVHVHGKNRTKRFEYIPRNSKGGYSIPRLLARARPFEVELVHETERRAQELRILWREYSAIRRALNRVEVVCRHRIAENPVNERAPARIELVPTLEPA